jgi:3-hydroxybutyryl-CoA dehydrogenase
LRKIGVIGSGLMGAGIAQVAAQAGLHVLMTDQIDEALQSAVGRIQHGLKRLEDRGRLNEDVDTLMGRIETTLQLPEFAGLGVVIPYCVAAGRSP